MGCLGGKEGEEPLLFFPLKQPQTVTLGKCFTLVMMYFCLYRLVVADLCTFMALGLTSQRMTHCWTLCFPNQFRSRPSVFFTERDPLPDYFLCELQLLGGTSGGHAQPLIEIVWIVLTDMSDQPATSLLTLRQFWKGGRSNIGWAPVLLCRACQSGWPLRCLAHCGVPSYGRSLLAATIIRTALGSCGVFQLSILA